LQLDPMYGLRDMHDFETLVSRHFKVKFRPDLVHIKQLMYLFNYQSYWITLGLVTIH
jgi:hypothetical protein